MVGTATNEAAFAEAHAFTERVARRWWSDFDPPSPSHPPPYPPPQGGRGCNGAGGESPSSLEGEGRGGGPPRRAGLLGIYRIGSLAHGGFSARYSDIDVAVIAAAPLGSTELDRMRAAASGVSRELAAKLSIFWADRSFRAGRMPPLDRADYLDHGLAIVERECVRPGRPTLAEIRDYLSGGPLERWTQQSRALRELSALGPSDHKPYLRLLLYPARFLYSWRTGAMASNDDAVEFLRRHPVPGLDIGLIERALECRRENRDLDALFPERSRLEDQLRACTDFISRG